jgi:thiol-disulfide isomerase/thioredoxin
VCAGGDDAGGGAYPGCPYGVSVGDVVADAHFRGLRTHDAPALEAVSFADFYDPEGALPAKLLFVNAGAIWCSPCRAEATELPSIAQKLGADVAFLSVLFQGEDGKIPANETDLHTWADGFSLPFWVVIDPTYQIGAYFDLNTPPFSMLIDPKSMKVVERVVGKPASLEQFIAQHL